jgi:hypothetical protein
MKNSRFLILVILLAVSAISGRAQTTPPAIMVDTSTHLTSSTSETLNNDDSIVLHGNVCYRSDLLRIDSASRIIIVNSKKKMYITPDYKMLELYGGGKIVSEADLMDETARKKIRVVEYTFGERDVYYRR